MVVEADDGRLTRFDCYERGAIGENAARARFEAQARAS
jgi:hypothetical protein